VDGIEIRTSLAELARATLALVGPSNVQIHMGDGRAGLPEAAPFDRILVSAGACSIPPALLEQLAPGGRIAIPVDDGFGQTLLIGQRMGSGEMRWTKSVPCLFVPLVG
jgi:protein-L-isoaspartate(D-aspartate) O-methyltransferase